MFANKCLFLINCEFDKGIKMRHVLKSLFLGTFLVITACKPNSEKDQAEQFQKQIEQEVIGLNQIEVGRYHAFSSPPQIDNSAGGACLSYEFSFKLSSEHRVEDFSLSSSFFEKTCQVRLGEMLMVGSGNFATNENKLLESSLSDALMTSYHDVFTLGLNKEASCGFTDWITNRRKSILNSKCISSKNGRMYFGHKNSTLVIYSCDDGQDINPGCKRVVLKKRN